MPERCKPENSGQLHDAVERWIEDRELTRTQLGEIGEWDVSQLTVGGSEKE